MNGYLLTAIAVLIFFSAFFSFAETALSFANKVRLKTLAEKGSKRAGRVLTLLDNFDKVLSTILISNNIVNITAAGLSTVLFTRIIDDISVATAVSTAVITVLILVFAEITPKSIAKEKPEAFSMFISAPIKFLIWVLTPINAVFVLWRKLLKKILKLDNESKITDDELINYVGEAEKVGSIDEQEYELIKSAIEFDNLDGKDVMVPRINVVAIPETSSTAEVRRQFEEHGFSRLPVYSKNIDNITGIIHIKDFYNMCLMGNKPLAEIIQPKICIPKTMKISDVLRLLQDAKMHMAIVVDEYGGTSGIVTLEDIVEELVGEIWDEQDEEETLFKRLDNDTFTVSGSKNLKEMFEELGVKDISKFESLTVSGWITEYLGRIPVVGENFVYKNLDITVTQTNIKRVLEAKIKILPVVEKE
jgi:CBS domain containing-hemolysin-like protein